VWVAFGAFVGLFAIATPTLAQDYSLVNTWLHPNPRENFQDRFGSSIAISGSTLFVGARNEQVANDHSGIVHVFTDAGWSEVGQLKSSVDADFDFGATIQLDGERALIANGTIDGGVVWFFEQVAGVWTEKLRVQGLVNEAFGYRIALRGDFAFIAAPRVGTGNVHVYRRVAETWNEVQLLTASDAQSADFFGYAIAFDGQRLAVGAPGNLLGATHSGVYTFSKVGDAFVEDGKIAGDPATHWFGNDVDVSGDTLIVNAPPAYQVTTVGKALVYQRQGDQWELDSELTVDGEASFPGGVALDGDTAWFGAHTNDPATQNIYAFQRTNGSWHQAQQLNFPNLGELEITSWDAQAGTFAIGFWNGLRTELVQIYRGPGHESSSGGGPAGGSAGAQTAGGSDATGGANAGGRSGDVSATAGSPNSSPSGGDSTGLAGAQAGAAASNAGASAAVNAPSSERGGCTLASSSNARAWPLAALAWAVVLRRKRRGERRRVAR
jgi:hypothetical protein